MKELNCNIRLELALQHKNVICIVLDRGAKAQNFTFRPILLAHWTESLNV